MKKVFIWGAKGHALVLVDILVKRNIEVVHFFDNDSSIKELRGRSVLGGWDAFLKWNKHCKEKYGFAIAIGGDNKGRYELQEKIKAFGHIPVQIIHSSAIIESSVVIGEGSHILAGAIICSDVRIGQAVIVNTGAQINHESVIEDGAHIMSGVTIAGCVTVKKFANVGSNATVFPRITIGELSYLGAGSVANQSIPDKQIWLGIPAKCIRKLD